ncbi:hypothetical protein [Hahella ganghwensis]|uniref:hypothetical protein n=1 Tax=Hahella ganghwensis TaxID=286420 RepID=UPI0003637779|nr:hypothetical protein [Hahella ganghwensis]
MSRSFQDRTPQEWLQLLEAYQQQLKARLKTGCQPSEYYLLADLDAAVDLVIRRFHNVNNGGNYHGVQF